MNEKVEAKIESTIPNATCDLLWLLLSNPMHSNNQIQQKKKKKKNGSKRKLEEMQKFISVQLDKTK